MLFSFVLVVLLSNSLPVFAAQSPSSSVVCDSYEQCLEQAKAGDVEAQYQVAVLLTEGIGMNEDEEATSIEWLELASSNGHIEATKELAATYLNGAGVPQDLTKAFSLFQKAKEAGDLEAQVHLALCYLNGKGVKKDRSTALKLLTDAAEKGDDLAQAQLGLCYVKGTGVTKNLIQAFAWLSVADENSGDNSYSRVKNEIFEKLSSTDKSKASKLEAVYLAQYINHQIA